MELKIAQPERHHDRSGTCVPTSLWCIVELLCKVAEDLPAAPTKMPYEVACWRGVVCDHAVRNSDGRDHRGGCRMQWLIEFQVYLRC